MEVKVCHSCRSLFQYVSGEEICIKCIRMEEKKFQEVKEYLRENPGANMQVVAQEVDVSTKLIKKFLRQGRLEVSPESPIALNCDRCGKRILTGHFCEECRSEMTRDLQKAKNSLLNSESEKESTGARMRFFKRTKS